MIVAFRSAKVAVLNATFAEQKGTNFAGLTAIQERSVPSSGSLRPGTPGRRAGDEGPSLLNSRDKDLASTFHPVVNR